MDQLMEFLNKYWPVIVAIGAFLDVLAGYLPDKWVNYIGAIRRLVLALRGKKASGLTVMQLVLGLFLLAFAAATFVLTFQSCKDWSWLSSYPSICSDQTKQAKLHEWAKSHYGLDFTYTDEASLLCDVADQNKIHLDYTSDILFVGDLNAIRNKPALRKDAISLFTNVRDFILANKDLLTGANFSIYVFSQLKEYPELGLAASPFLGQIQGAGPRLFRMKDVIMVLWYCDRNLAVIG